MNTETIQAFKDAHEGNVTTFDTVDEVIEELESDD